VAVVIFIIVAPLITISVTIDLPPASATQKPISTLEWVAMIGLDVGALLGAILFIGLPAWLVVRTARKIIENQPKANS
jgi:flagellar biogenesis protein FliO